jgi:2-amino-4-hydroxy-6-hydroxymethyldihydropteridine diphosphokinase
MSPDDANVQDDRPAGAVDAYVGLGSNRGARLAHLERAVRALDAADAITVQAVSPVYETEAHTLGDEAQPAFLNAVAHLRTTRSPEALLAQTQRIEQAAGRARRADTPRWAPRTLDLDLLTVGTSTRATERLTLPHPRLAERRFVLRPWADLAPNLRVPPPFDATVANLLAACSDAHALRRTDHTLSDALPADAARPGNRASEEVP